MTPSKSIPIIKQTVTYYHVGAHARKSYIAAANRNDFPL